MALILRQSTQIVVRIGPAVAVGDGFTPVTNLTLSGADEAEALRAGTATLDISGATFAAVTGADGWYDLTLSTTATSTVGELLIVINDDSLILPLFAVFQVVEEAIYDAIFAANANAFSGAAGSTTLTALATGSITAAVIATGAIDADAIASDAITDAKVASDVTIASVTGAVGSVTGSVGSVASGGITAASIADGAIDSATFASGTTIPRCTLVDTATTLTNLPAVTTDWLTAAGVSAGAGNKIADHGRRRSQANVEASSDGDSLSLSSLYGMIQQAQEASTTAAAGFLTVYRTDGSTSLGTRTLTTSSAAEPITGVS